MCIESSFIVQYNTQYIVQYILLYSVNCNVHQEVRLVFLEKKPVPPATWRSVYGTLYNIVYITVFINMHNIVQCTVQYNLLYTKLYCTVHCILYCTLHYTLHRRHRGWLIWPNPRGTLFFLSLIHCCWPFYFKVHFIVYTLLHTVL